eukprot:287904_1
MGAKPSKVSHPVNISSRLMSHALFSYIYRDGQKYGLHLPSELIVLCSKMIGFTLDSSILSSTEKTILFEYIDSTKVNLKHNICYFQLLYSYHKIKKDEEDSQLDEHLLAAVIRNKRNLVYVIQTEFNHVFAVFCVGCPQFVTDWRNEPGLRSSVSIYWLRSQFDGQSVIPPKEVILQNTEYWIHNIGRSQWFGMQFGGVRLYKDICFCCASRLNMLGNELCGGSTNTLHLNNISKFKIKHIDIYQMT